LNSLKEEISLAVERAIHFVMFSLILMGLCGVSAWTSYAYVPNDLLKIASIALSWGVILLILYLGFKKLNWDWWS
ncbi:MAG: hypothetical protein WAN82_01305, partial [Candidatus Bathyarchaeia archaeon]